MRQSGSNCIVANRRLHTDRATSPEATDLQLHPIRTSEGCQATACPELHLEDLGEQADARQTWIRWNSETKQVGPLIGEQQKDSIGRRA